MMASAELRAMEEGGEMHMDFEMCASGVQLEMERMEVEMGQLRGSVFYE